MTTTNDSISLSHRIPYVYGERRLADQIVTMLPMLERGDDLDGTILDAISNTADRWSVSVLTDVRKAIADGDISEKRSLELFATITEVRELFWSARLPAQPEDVAETIEPNDIAGTGQHSHEVPTTEYLSVKITDGNHDGTLVTLVDDEYVFAKLNKGKVVGHERAALIRIGNPDSEYHDGWQAELPFGCSYGCNLDCPDGLLLVGCSTDDELDSLGDVLWDSHEEAE